MEEVFEMSATSAAAPFLPVFHAVLNEGSFKVGKDDVEFPALEFFTDGSNSKSEAKKIHAEYAKAAKERKLNSSRNCPTGKELPCFTEKPYGALEKEWLGATVTFTDALQIPTGGPVKDEIGQVIPCTKIYRDNDLSGTVVGLSGNANVSLSVYVPGDGFYCVNKNDLTRKI